jgi:hypothetical protein
MPTYHIFQPACNTNETGPEYPQVQEMAPEYIYKAPDSVYALSKAVEQLPNFTPNLNYFVVQSRAKLTDLLSVAPVHGGLLVSSQLKYLLDKHNLTPIHKFYPANVQHKKQFHHYFWLHIICNLTDQVDYPNSTFFIYHNYKNNLGYVSIESKEDFTQQKEKIKRDNPGKTITIWAETIKLNKEFNAAIDLFEIGTFDNNYYISERLRAALVSEKITGCEISPAIHLIV